MSYSYQIKYKPKFKERFYVEFVQNVYVKSRFFRKLQAVNVNVYNIREKLRNCLVVSKVSNWCFYLFLNPFNYYYVVSFLLFVFCSSFDNLMFYILLILFHAVFLSGSFFPSFSYLIVSYTTAFSFFHSVQMPQPSHFFNT